LAWSADFRSSRVAVVGFWEGQVLWENEGDYENEANIGKEECF
jgi:hypothetical protein